MIAFLRFEIVRTLRNVRFLVFLIAFPVLLYLIYAKQTGTSQGLTVAAILMVSMAVWSGMGSAMFATGPQLAKERQNGWMRQLRVSPISAPRWFTAIRTLRFTTQAPDPSELLRLPGVSDVLVNGTAVTVRTGDADATLPALYALRRQIKAMEVGGGGLEEALIALTSADDGGAASTDNDAGAPTGSGDATPAGHGEINERVR